MCVFVAFGFRDEMRIRHIVVYDLSASTKSFHKQTKQTPWP